MVVRYIQNAESLADVSNVSKKNNRTSTEVELNAIFLNNFIRYCVICTIYS